MDHDEKEEAKREKRERAEARARVFARVFVDGRFHSAHRGSTSIEFTFPELWERKRRGDIGVQVQPAIDGYREAEELWSGRRARLPQTRPPKADEESPVPNKLKSRFEDEMSLRYELRNGFDRLIAIVDFSVEEPTIDVPSERAK